MTDYVPADSWHVPWSLPERKDRIRRGKSRPRPGMSSHYHSSSSTVVSPTAPSPSSSDPGAAAAVDDEEELEKNMIEEKQPVTVPRCDLTQLL